MLIHADFRSLNEPDRIIVGHFVSALHQQLEVQQYWIDILIDNGYMLVADRTLIKRMRAEGTPVRFLNLGRMSSSLDPEKLAWDYTYPVHF